MSSFLTSALALIVTLGLLIAFHEFGHYWVARRCGVKVLRFSIGFGKPLWLRRFGVDQTEFVLAAIPLGGYVKWIDDKDGGVAEEDLPRTFSRQSLPKRFAIVAAGPLFNFVFAIAAYFLMFVIGIPGIKPVVGEVQERSIAALAGLQNGDQILSIAGQPTPTWNTASISLLQAALDNDIVVMEVGRSQQPSRQVEFNLITLSPEQRQTDLFELMGIEPLHLTLPALIKRVEPGSAAERAGLQAGDKVVAMGLDAIVDWRQWVDLVQKNPGQNLQVTVLREGTERQIMLTPTATETATGVIGRVGAEVLIPTGYGDELRATEKYPVLQALPASVVKTWQMSVLTLRMIGKMVVGEVSVKNLSGPITIATYAGKTASIGLATFLSFLAVVSISLGVLNLLPIPVLDGGHLLNYVIEFVKGGPLPETLQLKMQQVGIVLLGMLMILAFYNDLERLFS